jgi:AcrR family transcriptional regulator
MAERGSYAKGIAKQREILEVALRLVAEKGYTNATLREIGAAVSLTKNGLLHHFGSKEELFAEILRRRDEVDRERHAAATGLEALNSHTDSIAHAAQVAGLVQLYVRFSAEATDRGHAANRYFVDRYEKLRAELTAGFERFRAAGNLRDDVDPGVCATQLIALLDGLQTQWLYDPTIDMSEHVRRFLEMVGATAPAHRS